MNRKIYIQLLCEGYEEWHYVKRLLSFGRYNASLYYFSEPINVKTNTQLINRFQIEYAKNKHDIIFIFCDVDKDASHYLEMINSLAKNMDITVEAASKLFIFGNPVTLQIVLSHFDKVSLTHVAKTKNAKEVERLTGIKDYSAKESQIIEMMNKISYSSYEIMKDNLKSISTDFHDVPSTNFLLFLNNIESDDDSWTKELIL